MAEQDIQTRIIAMLKQETIQLWIPPYTTETGEAGHEQMQELAGKYSQVLGFPQPDMETALEEIRLQAVRRGSGNKTFKETNIANLDFILPKKGHKRRHNIKSKLDITAQDLINKIKEECELKHIKLIVNGKVLSPDKRLDEQNVKNNSKIMVLKLSEPEIKKEIMEVEEKMRSNEESVQRVQKGFQILSERDGSEDPMTTPFLEIADQKGNPIQIPLDKKKQKEYNEALFYLLQAEDEFRKCNSALLTTVDNYAVLQLDIVWCYRALEALSCLTDCKQRLQQAENCFLKCYGEGQTRLQKIKGNTGGEGVLFLRLYLLQSLLVYLDGKENQAITKLKQSEELYNQLSLDQEKMNQLLSMGFTEQDARLGLRACRGNVEAAVMHITLRRAEREEIKQRERNKRRQRLEAINTLVELGYNKKSAANALHKAHGDLDEAYRILLDCVKPAALGSLSQTQTDRPKWIRLFPSASRGRKWSASAPFSSVLGSILLIRRAKHFLRGLNSMRDEPTRQ
ncbi:hypothetical protein HF521_017937 [Silurus meridionalis]|uniref:UBA domain-containing protein n=1 Tax=Silurus meridionalis TaxID=175797 RepID=A0A8T0BU67_SILME|nr:hypothetical protein HF521_017937 [Silurus meridionalis]